MAIKNQILYVVYNDTEKRQIAEFLNKDCAKRWCCSYFLRKAGHEYGKFLNDSWKTLGGKDFFRYALVYIEDMFENHSLKRKIWSDESQGFIEFDKEYNTSFDALIDKNELAAILEKKAHEIINGMTKGKRQ